MTMLRYFVAALAFTNAVVCRDSSDRLEASGAVLVDSDASDTADLNAISAPNEVYNSTYERANAAIVMMVRKTHLDDVVTLVNQIENNFNRKFHYDWIFLDKKELSDEFKQVTSDLVSGTAQYGIAPRRCICPRDWHDKDANDLIHDTFRGVLPYRYNATNFRHIVLKRGPHPLLDQYKYTWKIEPDTNLHIDPDRDVFKWMEEHNAFYGSTLEFVNYAIISNQYFDDIGQSQREGARVLTRLMGHFPAVERMEYSEWRQNPARPKFGMHSHSFDLITKDGLCPVRENLGKAPENSMGICCVGPYTFLAFGSSGSKRKGADSGNGTVHQ